MYCTHILYHAAHLYCNVEGKRRRKEQCYMHGYANVKFCIPIT